MVKFFHDHFLHERNMMIISSLNSNVSNQMKVLDRRSLRHNPNCKLKDIHDKSWSFCKLHNPILLHKILAEDDDNDKDNNDNYCQKEFQCEMWHYVVNFIVGLKEISD